MGRGWWKEPERHRLARMGIKTGHKLQRVSMRGRTPSFNQLLKLRKLNINVKTPQGNYKGMVKVSGRKLTKPEIKKIHKFAERLKKHKEIETPYALATYMHEKGYDINRIAGRKGSGKVDLKPTKEEIAKSQLEVLQAERERLQTELTRRKAIEKEKREIEEAKIELEKGTLKAKLKKELPIFAKKVGKGVAKEVKLVVSTGRTQKKK